MSGDAPTPNVRERPRARRSSWLRRLALSAPGVSPDAKLSARARVALVLEILLAYVELLRVLRRGDLASMVRTARHTPFQAEEPLAPADQDVVARRICWIVFRVVDALPTDKRCLINSLVLVRVLTHRSIGARLVLGVQSDGGFAAHAWVEHAGRPVMPTYDFHRLFEV